MDFVLEKADGSLVGIEVKSSVTVGHQDFKGLRLMAQELKKYFIRGIVLHTGGEVVPFDKNLTVVPVNVLWS